MGDTIDFRDAYFKKAHQENQRPYYKDENGDCWFEYCYEYDFLGKTFGIHLFARNKDEAILACQSVRQSLRLMGEVIEVIPA